MCLPPMIAVAGGLLSAAGSVMAGNAQAAAYEAQAKVAQQNARLAELLIFFSLNLRTASIPTSLNSSSA